MFVPFLLLLFLLLLLLLFLLCVLFALDFTEAAEVLVAGFPSRCCCFFFVFFSFGTWTWTWKTCYALLRLGCVLKTIYGRGLPGTLELDKGLSP